MEASERHMFVNGPYSDTSGMCNQPSGVRSICGLPKVHYLHGWCYWCKRTDGCPEVIDPYDAVCGYKRSVSMCPYCYTRRMFSAMVYVKQHWRENPELLLPLSPFGGEAWPD